MTRGPLIILSGPSGSGKSTIVAQLLEQKGTPLCLSVSATTRKPRPGEIEGANYFFWTRAYFEKQIKAGHFLEWASVFDNYYGTPKDEVERNREQGLAVLLEIDVQGAEQVKESCGDAVSIFVSPPSFEELERRLRARGTEDERILQQRLEEASREMQYAEKYDYRVVNVDLQETVAEISAFIQGLF